MYIRIKRDILQLLFQLLHYTNNTVHDSWFNGSYPYPTCVCECPTPCRLNSQLNSCAVPHLTNTNAPKIIKTFPSLSLITMWYLSDPNGQSSHNITNQVFGSIVPYPVNYRQVNVKKSLPIAPAHWRLERIPYWLRKETIQ